MVLRIRRQCGGTRSLAMLSPGAAFAPGRLYRVKALRRGRRSCNQRGACGSVAALGVSLPTLYCLEASADDTLSRAPESAEPTRPLTLCFASICSDG